MKRTFRRTALLLVAIMLALTVETNLSNTDKSNSLEIVSSASAATKCCTGAHTIKCESSCYRSWREYPNATMKLSNGKTAHGIWHQKQLITTKRFYCTKCGKEISYSTSVEDISYGSYFEYYWWSPREEYGTPFGTGIRG